MLVAVGAELLVLDLFLQSLALICCVVLILADLAAECNDYLGFLLRHGSENKVRLA
jgi:hypothetical protein